MTLRMLAALLALPLAAGAAAQPAPTPAQPPKLIVAIAVDQLGTDLFQQYRQHFTGGLRRLSQAVAFPNGYQSHAATETCPGHSTILTGARPARTGIIANNWFNLALPREDKQVYCAEDPRVAGASSRDYTASPYHLRVPALGDRMIAADPRSRVIAVAGKDRAAIMMGGQRPTQRWFRGKDSFVSDLGTQPTPAVAAVNGVVAEALAQPREPLALPPLCEARARPVPVEGGGKPVGAHRFGRAAGDGRSFMVSPEYDGAVLALAAALRTESRLGEGPATDLLTIGLSGTDYVGHTYGTQGAEMCLQLLALDRSLGDFFDRLDATGIDYAVVLTADHGGHDIPERHRDHASPDAARVDPALFATAMGKSIGSRLGLSGSVLHGDGAFGDMYVDRSLTAAQRSRVLAEAVRAYEAHPQVADVVTAAELRAAPRPSGPPDRWSLLDKAKASFDPERSGDFVVFLKPRITPIADTSRGYVATHGSPWDYDRQVPILFWRKGLAPFEQPLAVETVDIAPTLAALIGLRLPAGEIDGRCLDLLEGAETSCR